MNERITVGDSCRLLRTNTEPDDYIVSIVSIQGERVRVIVGFGDAPLEVDLPIAFVVGRKTTRDQIEVGKRAYLKSSLPLQILADNGDRWLVGWEANTEFVNKRLVEAAPMKPQSQVSEQ